MINKWFASDAVKQVLAAVALASGVLAVGSSSPLVKTIAAVVSSVLSSLGIVSGGTAGTQPLGVQLALGMVPPAPIVLPPAREVTAPILGTTAPPAPSSAPPAPAPTPSPSKVSP